MDLALGSAAGAQDVDLQAAAFEFAVEPTLLLDPHADLILGLQSGRLHPARL